MEEHLTDNDDQLEAQRWEQVLDALKSQDKNALKAVFSKQALTKADDFDGHMDYLFSFFQGSVQTWDKNAGPLTDGAYENGQVMKELKTWYSITTDQQKYLIFLLDYPVDTQHPDNVGLYSLRVIKAEDESTQFTYWQDMKIAGIYKPEE